MSRDGINGEAPTGRIGDKHALAILATKEVVVVEFQSRRSAHGIVDEANRTGEPGEDMWIDTLVLPGRVQSR